MICCQHSRYHAPTLGPVPKTAHCLSPACAASVPGMTASQRCSSPGKNHRGPMDSPACFLRLVFLRATRRRPWGFCLHLYCFQSVDSEPSPPRFPRNRGENKKKKKGARHVDQASGCITSHRNEITCTEKRRYPCHPR